jgi:hypothetical protein
MSRGRETSEGSAGFNPVSLSSSSVSLSLADVIDPMSESSRSEALLPGEEFIRASHQNQEIAYLGAENAHFYSYPIHPLQHRRQADLLAKQEHLNLFQACWALNPDL